jgi:hypothetical protein
MCDDIQTNNMNKSNDDIVWNQLSIIESINVSKVKRRYRRILLLLDNWNDILFRNSNRNIVRRIFIYSFIKTRFDVFFNDYIYVKMFGNINI